MPDREQTRRDAIRRDVDEWPTLVSRQTLVGYIKFLLAELEQAERKVSEQKADLTRKHADLLEAERERDEARAWVTDFISDDEDVDDRTLAEWFSYVRDWGNQGWYYAGKNEARLAKVPALVEALRFYERDLSDGGEAARRVLAAFEEPDVPS